MSIQAIVHSRGVSEVLHFTTHNGLLGMLHTGFVKSRKRLPDDLDLEHIFTPNARYRGDRAWLDYVNLSISEINLDFFTTSCRWHRPEDLWWCILSFDPSVLAHEGVHFATTNNIYTDVVRGKGSGGLERLFELLVHQYDNRTIGRGKQHPINLPTCRQAEVLYPGQLSLDLLQAVYVKTPEDQDEVHAQLALTGRRGVEVTVDPVRFGDNEAR